MLWMQSNAMQGHSLQETEGRRNDKSQLFHALKSVNPLSPI